MQRAGIPRGRHAPPLDVRRSHQRSRLLEAAARVFAGSGYAEASAEAISRAAGMSKATFYEHFTNKEDCILALFDDAAQTVLHGIEEARDGGSDDPHARIHGAIGAMLELLATNPQVAQTVLVESIGAGPRAAERRDQAIAAFAGMIDRRNDADARAGRMPRFASAHDPFAIVGAVFELVSRHLRLGEPADLRDLQPVIERLILGELGQPRG